MRSESRMWNRVAESMPRAELEALQLERLRALVARVSRRVPHYARGLKRAGVEPESLSSLADVARIPFTHKSDLRENYPFGVCAVSMEEVVRIHASSGTTGKPVVGPYTRGDLALWGEVMARTLSA